jgi:plasmid stabilization system protein ParE
MPYLVKLADRALRDIEAIYEFIEADASERAAAWFNDLAEQIYSLERFPERGAEILSFHELGHPNFLCLESENPAWTLRLVSPRPICAHEFAAPVRVDLHD